MTVDGSGIRGGIVKENFEIGIGKGSIKGFEILLQLVERICPIKR